MTVLLPASFAFAACTEETPAAEPVKLDAPVITVLRTTETSATLTWDEIQGASGYSYVIGDGETVSTRETSLTIEDLEAGTQYSMRIKAVSQAGGEYDSDWSLCHFSTSSQPAPTFQPIEIVNSLPTSFR